MRLHFRGELPGLAPVVSQDSRRWDYDELGDL